MKTINKRLEDLEIGQTEKPILVLWGDWDNPDICRIGGMRSEETLLWSEAIERYQDDYVLFCVNWGDGRNNEFNQ